MEAIVAGVDLGDKYSHVVVIDETGEEVERMRVRSTPDAFRRTFGEREPMLVALEVGTHSRWASKLLEELCHAVLVGNARKLRAIYDTDNKTDWRDAETLARIARFDPKLLYPIKHRGGEAQNDLARVKARGILVEGRAKLINFVRGMVKVTGQRILKCNAENFHKMVGQIPEGLRPALNPMMETIASLTEQISRYEEELAELVAEKYPEAKRLEQVGGVGPITSTSFVLTLEDPSRFKKARDVGPFLGLVPKKDDSGESTPQLRITKAGDKDLRRLLVQCAHSILGRFGADSDLRRWGLDLAARGGKNAKKRAAVAVARKLRFFFWLFGNREKNMTHFARQECEEMSLRTPLLRSRHRRILLR